MMLGNSEEVEILNLLKKHPKGLGQNEIMRELQCGKGTVKNRLELMQTKGLLKTLPGLRRQIRYLVDNEFLEKNRRYWRNAFVLLDSLIDSMANELKSDKSKEDKIVSAVLGIQREVSHIITRMMFLEHETGLTVDPKLEQARHGAQLEVIEAAYYRFIKILRLNQEELDRGLAKADQEMINIWKIRTLVPPETIQSLLQEIKKQGERARQSHPEWEPSFKSLEEAHRKAESRGAALYDKPIVEFKKSFFDLIDQRLPDPSKYSRAP
jgi:DNA-binding MarR family transcriptional regulator